MAGWLKPPPVVAITGNVELLCLREIDKAKKAARQTKRRIEYIDGDTVEIERLLASSVFFGDENILAIVRSPEKIDLDLISRHAKGKDSSIVLVLHSDGALRSNSKLGKLLDAENILHLKYMEPKPWEVEEKAIAFVVKEAKSRGKTFAIDRIPLAMVRACGTEYGFLAFEVYKLCVYCDALKTTVIQPEHLRGLVSVMHEASVFPITDALASANEAELLRLMYAVERTHRDPTMLVCGVLASSITSWLHVGSVLKLGMDLDDAARTVGASPARLRKSLLPASERWGEAALIRLLGVITEVERAVKTGKLDPWMLLQTRLAASCRAVRPTG